MPKLLRGACTTHALLDLAWRKTSGHSQHVHVEAYHEGQIFVDIPAMDGGEACLAVTVEVSRDTQRWADLARVVYYPTGQKQYGQIPVQHLGAYLRVWYQVQGSLQFGIDFVGKSFQVKEPPRVFLHE